MLIGYARVATAGASLDLQKEALDRAGVDRMVTDVARAADAKRPQWEQLLAQLRQGDTLVVCHLGRLGRSLRHLIETVEALNRRGVGFRSLAEHIDTTTHLGKLRFHAFLDGAQFARGHLRDQTRARRANGAARGRPRGPKPKLDEEQRAQAVTLYNDLSNSIDDICHTLQIARATLYRYLRKEHGGQAARSQEPNTGKGLATTSGE